MGDYHLHLLYEIGAAQPVTPAWAHIIARLLRVAETGVADAYFKVGRSAG